MPQLLSLDLATKVGWALGDSDVGDPTSGSYKLPSTGEDLGAFGVAFIKWVTPLIELHQVSFIAYESPIMPSITQLMTLRKLYSLGTLLEVIATKRGIPCHEIPAASWKASFTGKGNFGKTKYKDNMQAYPAIARCHELGWEHVTTSDEADALGIFVYACRMISPESSVRFDGLFRQAAVNQIAA